MENSRNNSVCYGAEDNNVSSIAENAVVKVIKVEADQLNDCNVSDSNIHLNGDSKVNNYSILKIKREKDVCATETNISAVCMYRENRDSIADNIPENSNVNNYSILKIKREKDECTTSTIVSESSSDCSLDAENNHNSSIVPQPCNLIVNKEPEYLNNDNIEKTTKYFSVKKLPNRNVSAIANDVNCEERSQSDVVYVFICNICKMSSTIEKDLFAMHMASHPECGTYECVVCNEVFNSIKHWKDHMSYHQKLMDLHFSELIQSRILMEPQELLRKRENEYQNPSMNLIAKKIKIKKTKRMYSCNICFKIMPCKLTLMAHKTLHSEPNPLDKPNHITVEKPKLMSHDLAVESNENNIAFCSLCNKQFGHKGALTNHMRIHYNCIKCGKQFLTEEILLQHNKNH